MAPQELQTDEHLDGEPTDELFIEAIVVVADDQFVEIAAEKFKEYANMLTKNDEIFNSYDIGLLLFILLLDMTQYLDLDEGLLAEFGVVFDNLESRFQFGFMVQDFEYLSV